MSIATSTPFPTLLLATFATFAVAGCGISVSFDDGDATRRTVDESFDAAGLHGLDLDTDNGAVEIRGGAGDDIDVHVVLRESRDGDADYTIEVDGDRLVVDGECDSGWFRHCSVGFVVTVPDDFDVDATTDNGRIELTDVDGDVRLRSDNGAIDADGLGAAVVDARTDNGRIRLGFGVAPTDVTVDTDNGAIVVRVPDTADAYAVDADTDNGAIDVDVRVDSSAERFIVARSDNGSIDIDDVRS